MSQGSVFAFWFLNHRLEKTELRRQLSELKNKGFAGVFPHPRAGLLTPYLSAEWFDCIRFIANECRRLGLEFWLYDEDPFPSGAAGGRILLDHPEFARRELVFEEHTAVCHDGNLELDFQGQKLVAAFALLRYRGGWRHAADLTGYCGPVRRQWTRLRRTKNGYYRPYREAGREHWRTGTAGVNWRVSARLPAGRYRIVGVFAQRQDYNTWGGLPDLLNPAAVRHFMALTHERYRLELGPELFAGVRGIFTDEAKVTGDFPWTDALPEHFLREYGTDLLPLLPHLKYELDSQTPLVRHRYRRLLGKMFRATLVKPICDWCEQYGIQSTGHFSPEEDPIGQQAMTPDLMGWMRDMRLPGVDLIGSNIGTRPYCIINIGPKLASSAARQAGRTQVLSESLGVSGEDLSLARAKTMLDWQMVLGVNKFALHGQYYSLDGPRKREAPPSIFETAPYWPHFKSFADYLERTCRLLRQGRRVCDLAVLYPTAHINATLPEAKERLAGWRKVFGEWVYWLQAHGFDFDFVSEPGLAAARGDAAALRVGRCSYQALLVPEVELVDAASAAVMRKLRIPVLYAGARPRVLETGRRLTGAGRVCDRTGAEAFLARYLRRPLTVAGTRKDLFRQTRLIRGKTYHFVFNPTDKPLRCGLTPQSGQWLEARDEQANKFRPLHADGRGVPLLKLPPLGAALLREAARTTVRPAGPARTFMLRGPWTLKPCGDNTLLLDHWRDRRGRSFRLPIPYDSPQLPARSELRCCFFVKARPSCARLVWDEAGFGAPPVLTLNGHRLKGERCRVYDAHNMAADAARRLRPGWNEVAVSFETDAMPPMHDPLRLMGRFRVVLRRKGYALESWIEELPLREPGDWAGLGFPFYSGTMVYATEFELPQAGGEVRLRIDGVRDLAAVQVNGHSTALLAWPPYECDISKSVRAGTNRLRLHAANSFANFIDGERLASGITGKVAISVRR